MDLDELPLLHQPDLMLAILRVAATGGGTLDDCVAHLRQLLRQARERIPDDEGELRERLENARWRLRQAELIESANGERFRITPRGRRVLDENPRGVDETVLMQFQEFRRAIAQEAERATGPAAGPGAYEAGYAAFLAGKSFVDNPLPGDSSRHLEWQNGWSQARDDALAHTGAEPLTPTAS